MSKTDMKAVVYEIETGVVLACGEVSVDKEEKTVHDKEAKVAIRGGKFDDKIAVVDATDLDLTGIEPLLWRYIPSSKTFVVNENCEAFTPQEEE